MDPKVELAQALQRNEVHAIDQPAQFLAQALAGVALDRQVQVLRQLAIGLGDAGMQANGFGGGDLGEEGGQFRLARLQRLGAGFRVSRSITSSMNMTWARSRRRPISANSFSIGAPSRSIIQRCSSAAS
jgi:hypothetical protein